MSTSTATRATRRKRARRINCLPTSDEEREALLRRLEPNLRALAWKYWQGSPHLKAWEPEDLIQEAYLKAIHMLDNMQALGNFRGEAKVSTLVLSTARNMMVSMARAAALRPKPMGHDPWAPEETLVGRETRGMLIRPGEQDPGRVLALKEQQADLLRWLRENPHDPEWGWQVFKLLLRYGADWNRVALGLTVYSGSPWTTERVRSVIRRVRDTDRGAALCDTLGLNN